MPTLFIVITPLIITFLTYVLLEKPLAYFAFPALRQPRDLPDTGKLIENYAYIIVIFVIFGSLGAISAEGLLALVNLKIIAPLPDNVFVTASLGIAVAGLLRFVSLTHSVTWTRSLRVGLPAYMGLVAFYLLAVLQNKSLVILPETQSLGLTIGIGSVITLGLVEVSWLVWSVTPQS